MPDEAYCTIQVGGHRGNSPSYEALVDAADAAAVGAYLWSMYNGYAARKVYIGGKRLNVRMHREILGLGPNDPDVDHIYGNTLDNRRENLRVCTHAQNRQNRQNRSYRGASWHAETKRWVARAQLGWKFHYLGLYDTEEEAAAIAAAWRREHMPYSADARSA